MKTVDGIEASDGAQCSALVEAVQGDYFNVVGLPVALLVSTLKEFGVDLFTWDRATGMAVG